MSEQTVAFIAGPTASGKSGAALALAQAVDGEIINADAMQVYSDLRIVTARPSPEEESIVPHHLYGVLGAGEACSAGRWARMAADLITDIRARETRAIVVGGTGLYFRALAEGLSPIPETPSEIREAAMVRREALGAAAFREEVLSRDPAMEHLAENDAQRLQRAWEVFEATGKPLSYYQSLPREPLINGPVQKAVIELPREELYARCDERAAQMLEEGAVEEVRELLLLDLDPSLPVMKALGVPEIAGLIRGEYSPDEALAMLQQNTRRFAKRQSTWFRNQAVDWQRFDRPEVSF